MQRYICNRAAGVCKKKPPPLTKTRKHDEKFQAMSVRPHAWQFGARFSRRDSAQFGAQLGTQLGAQFGAIWRAILSAFGRHYAQADEKQMQDMQSNLKETGMSGTMYRREDLAGMMDKMKDMVSDPTPRGCRAIRRAQLGAML